MENQSNTPSNDATNTLTIRSQHSNRLYNQGKGYGTNPDGSIEEYNVIWRAKNYDCEVVDIPENQ
jgi:hypothetical protein